MTLRGGFRKGLVTLAAVAGGKRQGEDMPMSTAKRHVTIHYRPSQQVLEWATASARKAGVSVETFIVSTLEQARAADAKR